MEKEEKKNNFDEQTARKNYHKLTQKRKLLNGFNLEVYNLPFSLESPDTFLQRREPRYTFLSRRKGEKKKKKKKENSQ